MSLGPQMSMHTTLDLVLLLLDDLDAGRDIDRLRTEQLRAALLSSDGALLHYYPILISIFHCLMLDLLRTEQLQATLLISGGALLHCYPILDSICHRLMHSSISSIWHGM